MILNTFSEKYKCIKGTEFDYTNAVFLTKRTDFRGTNFSPSTQEATVLCRLLFVRNEEQGAK